MLSEGHDRGSHARSMDVLTFAEKENVIIYSITYSPFVTPFTVKRRCTGAHDAQKSQTASSAYDCGHERRPKRRTCHPRVEAPILQKIVR